MFTIGEVDVTFLIPAVLCFGLFCLQLLLCFKAKHMAVKLIPVYLIVAVFLFAAYFALFAEGGGFLDLSDAVAAFFAIAGAIMGLFVGAAWLIWKQKTK